MPIFSILVVPTYRHRRRIGEGAEGPLVPQEIRLAPPYIFLVTIFRIYVK